MNNKNKGFLIHCHAIKTMALFLLKGRVIDVKMYVYEQERKHRLWENFSSCRATGNNHQMHISNKTFFYQLPASEFGYLFNRYIFIFTSSVRLMYIMQQLSTAPRDPSYFPKAHSKEIGE